MKKTIFTKHLTAVLFIAALLLLTGCSKVTQEHYDQLAMGMKFDGVEQILGTATNCMELAGMLKKCVWSEGKKEITVNFISDNVVLFTSRGLK